MEKSLNDQLTKQFQLTSRFLRYYDYLQVQKKILMLLQEKGPTNQNVIEDKIKYHNNLIVEFLISMDKQGLIQREEINENNILIKITEKGNERLSNIDEQCFYESLSVEEKHTLLQILKKLNNEKQESSYRKNSDIFSHNKNIDGLMYNDFHNNRNI